jgi:hypothetical protein
MDQLQFSCNSAKRVVRSSLLVERFDRDLYNGMRPLPGRTDVSQDRIKRVRVTGSDSTYEGLWPGVVEQYLGMNEGVNEWETVPDSDIWVIPSDPEAELQFNQVFSHARRAGEANDRIVYEVQASDCDCGSGSGSGSQGQITGCGTEDQEQVRLIKEICLHPIPDYTGATASANGSEGVVPKPMVGDQNKYLKGDGTWDTITPEDIGAAPDGHSHTLTLGGDLAGTGPVTGSVNATIVNSAITTAKLADNAVTSAKISDLNVTTAKLADGSVTNAKLRNSIGISVIGRALNTTGVPADIQANEANTFLGSNANNNGILFRPIFLAYNESIRTTNLAVSASGYVDAGISVTLVAGTWVVGYHASAELQFSAGSFGQFRCRLFNVTTSAEVANTSARGAGRNDIGFILGACSMHQRLILASTTTIRLEVEFVGLSMTWTTRNLFAGSLIYAMRIG